MNHKIYITLFAAAAVFSVDLCALQMKSGYTYQQKELRSFDEAVNLANAYSYLNEMRQAVGLDPYKKNSMLEKSASGHALYLTSNNVFDHYQSSSLKNYTGYSPSDREKAAGYNYVSSGENIAAGPKYAVDSVNSLMEAIFHRFGFMSPANDEVGISFRYDHPTYKTVSAYNMGATKYIDKNASWMGIFPVDTQTNVKIDFYSDEEEPDPVPDKNRVGYPISITFSGGVSSTQGSFELLDSNTNKVSVRNITGTHVPKNNYCIIPENPLSYGTTYKAVFNGTVNGAAVKKEWRFTTAKLDNLSSQPSSLKMSTNETKHIYLYGGSGSYKSIKWRYYEPNPTSSISMSDNEVEIKSNSNSGEMTLEITDSDGRILTVPLSVSPTNTGIADANPVFAPISKGDSSTTVTTPIVTPATPVSLLFLSGWNIVGSPVNGSFTSSDLSSSGKVLSVWGFNASTQSYYAPATIDPYKGFWVNASSAFSFSTTSVTPFDYALSLASVVTNAPTGKWSLLSVPFSSSRAAVLALGASAVWTYDASKSIYSSSDAIPAGVGFWLKK